MSAATANVGELSIKLGLYTGALEQDSKRAIDAFERMDASAAKLKNTMVASETVLKSGGGFGRGGAQIAQQLGFGMQDFSSQLMNSKNLADGLGRGIMSVSNNVQMMGAAFGPTGMAITAIGGAVAGMVLPATIKWLMNTEAEEKALKDVADQYERIAKLNNSIVNARFTDSKDLANSTGELKKQLAVLREKEDAELKLMAPQRNQLRELRGKLPGADKEAARVPDGVNFTDMDAAIARSKALELRDEIAKLEKAIAPSNERLKGLGEDKRAAQAKLYALQPAIRQARELEAAKEIAKFKQEDDAATVVRNKERLDQRQNELKAEIAEYEKALAKKGALNKEELKLELEDRKQQLQDVTRVIAGVGGFAEGKKGELDRAKLGKEQDKLSEKEQRERKQADEKAQREKDQLKQRFLSSIGRFAEKDLGQDFKGTPYEAQAKEVQRIRDQQEAIDKEKDKLKEIIGDGKAAGPSRGVDIASSDGVSALNRAIAGTNSDKDGAKARLKELERLRKNSDEQLKRTATIHHLHLSN